MAEELEVTPGRSRLGLQLRFAMLTVLLVAVMAAELSFGARLVLVLALALEAAVAARRPRVALVVQGGHWWLRDGQGRRPVPDCRVVFLSPLLVVLAFGHGVHRRCVPVFADAVPPERFRELLVAARCGALP